MAKQKLDADQKKALKEARNYIQSLELEFKATYCDPELADIRPEDQKFMNPHQPPTHCELPATKVAGV